MAMGDGISLFNLPDLTQRSFTDHNQRAANLWGLFWGSSHGRVPVKFNTTPRMLMLDLAYNTRNVSYRQFMEDPDIMAQAVLEWQYWCRFMLPDDQDKGLPAQWTVNVDFQNVYDAAWLGCPVHYPENQIPHTTSILNDDNKRMLFDRPIPDPFGGEWAERWFRFNEVWERKREQGWTFLGAPVVPDKTSLFTATDGVFTTAALLRGATNLCLDLLADPDYAHELLHYVYEAIAARLRAWRSRPDVTVPQDLFGIADDAIELLSVEQYKEFVLPLHKRIYDEFSGCMIRGIHLCGHVQRLLPIVRHDLGVFGFDTGFPLDFAQLRRELGNDAFICGGPRAQLFVGGDRDELVAETERILQSGVLQGGRFILQEGNNLPPRTPLDFCQAVCDIAQRAGRREGWW